MKDITFLLHPEIEKKIAIANQHIIDWSESRLGTRLQASVRSDGIGVRSEEDLLTFTDDDLSCLVEFAVKRGMAGVSNLNSIENIAELVHRIRSSYIV